MLEFASNFNRERLLEHAERRDGNRALHPRPNLKVAYAEPSSDLEVRLAGIWGQILGVDRIGVNDNFFDLGGDSLMATRLFSILGREFGADLSLRTLFEAPTLADLAARVEAVLGSDADRLIPPLVPVPREGWLPLSFAQQRLWFIDQLEPGRPIYNIPVALRIEGLLRPEVLALCLGEIVRRHEALRTVFPVQDGAPVQVIRPAAPFQLAVVDLSGLPEITREALFLTLAAEEAGRPFNLARDLLLRGMLFRLSEKDHVVALTLHHIVGDGWSMGILVREVGVLYTAFAMGRPSPLSDLPVQYADFAVWQHSWLHGSILEEKIAFWRRQLAGLPPLLELPTDRPRPAKQSLRGAARALSLPARLIRQEQVLSRREGATLFMVLLAGFQALLARYSGQQDLAVGTPVAGRNRVEIDGLIGFFANTLVLRGNLGGEPSFLELLSRVRETTLASHMYQDLPFERLVQELTPERSLAHTPLFQVVLALQNSPVENLEIQNLRLRPIFGGETTTKFDLTLNLMEHDSVLVGVVEYATDLFDATTIDRLILHYELLLTAALDTPELSISELPLFSYVERHQMLDEWNDTGAEENWEGPVSFMVEHWARERPGSPAVVDPEGRMLTYGELDERSGRLASFLRTLGVGPETVVGVLAQRSPDVLVALLGIMKTGAANVPLDPSYPTERLALILAETAAPVVLTQEALLDGVPGTGARVVCLDRDWEEIEHCSAISATMVEPDHLAYVLYTSGSTGRPKGVQVPHRGLMNLVRWDLRAYGTGPGDCRTQVASLGFDASVWEIWSCLATGAVLHLPEDEVRLDPRKLGDWLADRGITVSFLPTPLAEALLTTGLPEIPTLRLLLVGGDRLRLRPNVSCGFSVLNHYGPTEASVVTTAGLVASWPCGEPGLVPSLGRPIDRTQVYLLDRFCQQVPLGVTGELLVGGSSLARGYLKNPGLTAERFVPNPFGQNPGERLYRTGDLCRYRFDGTLEFLGRCDHQVKIRGLRIELGEIEAALSALAEVREAVVVAREEISGTPRLVAYVVGRAGELAVSALRRFLQERLPDYMVPAAFVILDELPLTPNGKVDRKALPAPEHQCDEDSYLAPRSPVEEILAGIWAELLGLERIGTNSNFFDLGGHSLLAVRVMSRLRSALGVDMPLRDLFEAPTLENLAARVQEARRVDTYKLAAPPLVRVPRDGYLPLSFAQRRLWFIDQLEPGSPLYNIPVVLRIDGSLQHKVLALCFSEIVCRHEALRTTFVSLEGSPVQVVQPAVPFDLPLVDLTGLPENRREEWALTLAGEQGVHPFDLTGDLLLRGVLFQVAEDRYIAALTMHHIASDGWSMGLLLGEVRELYPAFVQGKSSPLPELPVQYGDFAAWQRSWLHGEVLKREISFWRRQLAGLPPRLDLPTDRPRPSVQSFRGTSWPVRLSAELTRQLQTLSRREGATLFMVLLAGFQALLARYSGQEDLAVGTPVSGRNRVEIEGLIGFFVNTLVLRGDLSGEPSLQELLCRVRETSLAAHAHQDVPFEILVQELSPERSLAHSPLFQVMFVLQNAPVESLEIQDLLLQPANRGGTTAKFDLTLSLEEQNGELVGMIEHATDLFDASTIGRLVGHYERLLMAAVAKPDKSALALPLLSMAEREQILVEWNDTGTVSAPQVCLHELIEKQVRRTPEAVALIAGTREFLYRELDDAADRLAARLRHRGVGPEVVVGICLERSAEMVAALLGILKAEAAYLPLDPQLPRTRLASMLASARVTAVVSDRRLAAELPWSGPLVLVDQDSEEDSGESGGGSGKPVRSADPENLAYVLYTSGSTGTPKGIAVPHRSAVELVHWAGTVYGPEELAGVLASTSLSFDLSVFELWVPLSWGGRVILTRNVLELSTLPSSQWVTLVNTVPSAMSELVNAGRLGASIRTVNLAGEPLPRSLADRIYAMGTVEQVWNLYGPSEDTTYSTFSRVARMGSSAPSIGRPITATKAYVLGAGLELVPVGVPGELHLSGAGLVRGYLHRPDLTAERFIPNPFAAEPGTRLYRTGDLVRWTVQGDLEFLGRLDHQVKVRGFRIELGEIERVLVSLGGISEAVLVVREDTPGDRRLVAYVVGEVAIDELRRLLRERLPDYMVPAAFVTLAALPLTPNGKVDRKALPAPEWRSLEEDYLAPRTWVEEVLAGIWTEVLGLERVGVAESFFDLGGHSLLATRVMSRLRNVFGVDMPLRDLFEAPRLVDLATRVEEARRAGAGRQIPPLASMPRQGSLPLSFAQQRLWFIDQLEPSNAMYNIPVALRVEGPLDSKVLELSLGEIVRRHEALRTVFAAQEGSPMQVIKPAAPFELSVVDLSELPERTRAALVLTLARQEAGRPFNLAHGPLVRGVLLRLTEGDHVVAITMHHIVGDGWSMGILVRELKVLYEAFSQGRPSPLLELSIQYADFAVWQRSWLQGDVLEAQLDYWNGQLAGAPAVLELPLDRPRPAAQNYRGARHPVVLSSFLTKEIGRLCRQQGVTPFMALLAAWVVLLGRHAGQEDVLVGAPIAGRNRWEIEDLIGFFVNTLVLRSDLSGCPSFGEVLNRMRRTTLDAFTHQDIPFERIVEEVMVERNLAVSPLFQVLFALQNAPMEDLEVPGLVFSPLDMDTGFAKFDLSLTLQESPAGFVAVLEHSADLFDGSTVERLLARYAILLEAAVKDPSLPVTDLPLLLSGERQQALVEWNDTTASYPGDCCLHELIAAQVRRTPAALALAAGEAGAERLTFATLDAAAKHLAARLRILGVGPEEVVALYLERSTALGIAVLAVLKAGGAFLPLDLANPRERLAWVLQDAKPLVVLTDSGLAPRLPNEPDGALGKGPRVVCLDLPAEEEAAAHPTALPVSPDNLAYVIYTSGSTGRPKGTMIPHRGVVNYLSWAVGAYRVEAGCGAPVHTSLAFDLTLTSLLAPWLAGRCALLVPEAEGVAALGLALAGPPPGETGFSLVKITPAHLLLLAEQTEAVAAGRTEALVVGGEALFGESLEAWRSAAPTTRVVNEYGPTETVVGCCVYEAPAGMLGDGPVPIGRPIANSRLYVVDGQLQPVPLGTPGELLIGGVGLARGYLRRPGLTAERFIPDALGEAQGGRLYRTGDRVRQRPDGILEFLGRADHQVKIRGFRIELGEIEAALASHPAVRECVLLVREDVPGSRLLAAYVVLNLKAEIGDPSSSLRSFLGERLPEYMVPSAIVVLDALPLSPNGKLDRRALPVPQGPRAVDGTYTAPTNPVEELLAGIWAEVLGIERVGIHESFFALGGHSLLATQVISRIRAVLGTELPLRRLFESPTIVGLARAVQKQGSALQAPPLVPVLRDRDLPVSYGQQRLWLVDQIEPGSPAYNMPMALRLIGEIEPRLLERIFSEIVRRHETLRTTFASREDRPVQVISPPDPVAVPVLDLASLPESERETQARDLAVSQAQRPFDLRRGPLLRLLLVRLAGTDHLLLLTLHHIVSDGWSMGVLVREMAALYEAFLQGRPSPFAELPVQYADFAVWQRSWLQGEVLDAQLDFWKRQLKGAPAVLEMPLDRPRPAVRSYRGARRPVVLSSPLSEALERLSRQQGVTPFMTLLAAWAVLLGRHAGQDDVLVGVPVAGRDRREIEGLVGFFLNTLVLRSDLSGSPSLAEFLGRVRRTALDAFSNQDLPFERLVEDLAPERSLAYAPLFQVMFVLQNVPTGDLTIPGLRLLPVDVDAGQAKFDLSLTLVEGPEGFTGALTYATDLFDPSTAERLIAGFQTLLTAVAEADPAAPLHGLEVLPEAERRQLLVEWSAEETRTSDLSLSELFERQAERTPDAVAVIYEEERWTYRDLLRRSREIAGFLREQGVGSGDRVAILDRRSPERLARVLGVLAAGAAFVAVDREQPRARRAEILADVAPVWVFPPRPPLPVEREGEMGVGVAFLPEGDTPASPKSCSRGSESCPGPAYVVYTSGSTGRPKGILAHHQGAATYLEWVIRIYGLSESDIALQLAPLTFDASLRDTLAPLAAGGRVVIVPEDVVRDPAALLERMATHGITCLPSIVPSLLRLLVEEALASGRKVPSLRLILASGERLHGADAVAVQRAFGERVSLVNQYGPSEATMCSTWYAVTADNEARPALPVGRPAASARVFLLDQMLRLVPLGAVGEICFGGPGLSFGYLGQPDRTAEVFVPDPFGAPGERLYRTGDRGRYRPDGVLELLGRIDFQVKIRGQRIEPGEIEAVLSSHPAVRQVVVAVRGEDEPRLVAWLVAEGVNADDLRAFLADRLPASMVPADWAFLNALPLTLHGKVDRSRLPEPNRERTAAREPRDQTELRLVRLWEEVLGIQPVGVSDNFFALGGHSLSAMRILAGVRRLFGRDFPLSALLQNPTLETFADLLRRGNGDLSRSPLVLLAAGREGAVPLYCIHGAGGQVIAFADLARALHAAGEDRPVFALEAPGLSDDQPPLERIEEMAKCYLTAIREVQPHGPYRLLGYSMGSKIAFEMARRLERDGETVERLSLVDVPASACAEEILEPEIPAEIRILPDFDSALAGRHLAVWRANQEASRSWIPEPFGGKVHLIVAEQGICTGASDATLGWGSVAKGGVEVVYTPGDHFSLLRPPHVQALVGRICDGP